MAVANDPRTGQTIVIPDGLSDDQVRAQIASTQLRDTPQGDRSQLVANLAGALQSAGPLTQATPQATLPQGFATGAGLNPEQITAMLQMQQQSNQDVVAQQQAIAGREAGAREAEAERAHETGLTEDQRDFAERTAARQSVVQQLEAEKDRTQEIKLEDIKFKNEQSASRLKDEQTKAAVEREAQLKVSTSEATGATARNVAGAAAMDRQGTSTASTAARPPASTLEAQFENLRDNIAFEIVDSDPQVQEFKATLRERATAEATKQVQTRLRFGEEEPSEEQIKAAARILTRQFEEEHLSELETRAQREATNRAFTQLHGEAGGAAPAVQSAAATPPAVADERSEQRAQAVAWANANPQDPRAQAILQNFGGGQ